ncbi:Hypothetical protein SMAX5B_013160 [Scophthalmus maximus]|uniref:Uncharacterized protein n=1 Tax=Scophthalmus maximus TaxID=52904 RepID=A0A2U9BD21_SCOMX|nr:Hypothetical protein SMAX5B_013160 [Scophthalmus maximus]KAF0043460.1 hypothetical protein F2P81_004797 [Scophthalmus maximus]
MSNAPGSLPPSAPFTDIRDVAVSLPRDPSAVWANADKMTQCKYEVRAGRLGKQSRVCDSVAGPRRSSSLVKKTCWQGPRVDAPPTHAAPASSQKSLW